MMPAFFFLCLMFLPPVSIYVGSDIMRSICSLYSACSFFLNMHFVGPWRLDLPPLPGPQLSDPTPGPRRVEVDLWSWVPGRHLYATWTQRGVGQPWAWERLGETLAGQERSCHQCRFISIVPRAPFALTLIVSNVLCSVPRMLSLYSVWVWSFLYSSAPHLVGCEESFCQTMPKHKTHRRTKMFFCIFLYFFWKKLSLVAEPQFFFEFKSSKQQRALIFLEITIWSNKKIGNPSFAQVVETRTASAITCVPVFLLHCPSSHPGCFITMYFSTPLFTLVRDHWTIWRLLFWYFVAFCACSPKHFDASLG